MSFFNPKEQVLTFRITQHGKRLLQQGKFKPVYYSFSDEDVIYDASYFDVTESINSIQSRIKEAPRTEKTSFDIIETNKIKQKKNIRAYQTEYAISDPIVSSLGNSSLGTQYCPAWNVKYLIGSLTGSEVMTGSNGVYWSYSKLRSEIKYRTSIESNGIQESVGKSNDINGDNPAPSNDFLKKVYPDGTFVQVLEDTIVLDVFEENTEFLSENFDIEVFQIEEVSGSFVMNPLYFIDSSQDLMIQETSLNPTNVEYWFNILVDDEIPDSVFCGKKIVDRSVFSSDQRDCKVSETHQDSYHIVEVPDECEVK